MINGLLNLKAFSWKIQIIFFLPLNVEALPRFDEMFLIKILNIYSVIKGYLVLLINIPNTLGSSLPVSPFMGGKENLNSIDINAAFYEQRERTTSAV